MPRKDSILGDHYYREAKRMGYRSRSALKLLEICQRFRIMKHGEKVLDLGAAPGGWLQVACRLVGEEGLVIGVDISEIEPLPCKNVVLLRGDARSPEMQESIARASGGMVDVITSDMAPKFTGIHDVDHGRQVLLAGIALELADKVLKPGGKMVIKVLMGSDFESFRREVRNRFSDIRIFKPSASRDSSSEVYLVCRGFRKNPQ
ncbi:MAG: RlmE family RNA methyltransferase [Candidatus Methanosuratincola sp.]